MTFPSNLSPLETTLIDLIGLKDDRGYSVYDLSDIQHILKTRYVLTPALTVIADTVAALIKARRIKWSVLSGYRVVTGDEAPTPDDDKPLTADDLTEYERVVIVSFDNSEPTMLGQAVLNKLEARGLVARYFTVLDGEVVKQPRVYDDGSIVMEPVVRWELTELARRLVDMTYQQAAEVIRQEARITPTTRYTLPHDDKQQAKRRRLLDVASSFVAASADTFARFDYATSPDDDLEEARAEALGMILAQLLDGALILKAAAKALDEVNYHKESAALIELARESTED